MNDYKLIAMIPARMGSRRIPKKNIRYMLDKPLIQYPIDLALQNGSFAEVWVNTESAPLGHACEKLGARFHQRPAELSTDKATNRDFTYEFLKKHECDYVVMVNPTSPVLRPETLEGFVRFLKENDYDSIMSVVSYKAEAFFGDTLVNFTGEDKIPSEKLEPVETVVWALTAWKRESFISMQESGRCPIFGGKLGRFAIPKDEAADLDTEEDWNIAQAALLARREEAFAAPRYMELDE
jgi:CMP-N-acetylneuraminic acid synthetase